MADINKMSWTERLFRVFGSGINSSTPGAYRPTISAITTTSASSSLFGEDLVVQRTPIIELNSSYGTSEVRDEVVLLNGGTEQLAETGEIQLQTGVDPNGSVSIRSATIGRYIPGYGAEIGIGIREGTVPTGTQSVKWGGVTPDNNDGIYFLYDADGIAVVRLNNGVENTVRQADWNRDKLDGTGLSKVNVDLTQGKIWQVEFSWYGYGVIVFGLVDAVEGGTQRFIPCHEFSAFSDTSIRSPNLKVFVEAKNGGTTASNLDVRLGGRQYAVVGKYVPKYRFAGERRSAAATTTTIRPLISFKRKSGFDDRVIKLEGFTIANKGVSEVYVEVRVGGTLTGAVFDTPRNHTPEETALESDYQATAITGGLVVWAGDIISSGQQTQSALADRNVDQDIPNGTVVTLCAASFSGTPDLVSGFRMREEW